MIDNWRQAIKFLSIQVQLVFSALLGAWILLTPEQMSYVLSFVPIMKPEKVPAVIALFGFLSAVAARLKAQPTLTQDK
jgi:hypothetical protein